MVVVVGPVFQTPICVFQRSTLRGIPFQSPKQVGGVYDISSLCSRDIRNDQSWWRFDDIQLIIGFDQVPVDPVIGVLSQSYAYSLEVLFAVMEDPVNWAIRILWLNECFYPSTEFLHRHSLCPSECIVLQEGFRNDEMLPEKLTSRLSGTNVPLR